jgi:hypothetical protein
MVHERLDVDRWKSLFPVGRMREEVRRSVREHYAREPHLFEGETDVEWLILGRQPSGGGGCSPADVAVHEQLVDEALLGVGKWQEMPERTPTDVFAFALGEPNRREATKYGGLPYRPKGEARPTNGSDEPMTFVGQVCFADSHDLEPVPRLPGDVLLVFGDTEMIRGKGDEQFMRWIESDPAALYFEWRRVGDVVEPTADGEVPETDWKIEPCHGVIHRAHDYPEHRYRDQFDIDRPHRSARIIGGTKIGGIPRWLQDEEPLSGVHLCTLGPLWPRFGYPYPFVNVEEMATSDSPYLDRLMTWGNWETVYVFVDNDGRPSWVLQYT